MGFSESISIGAFTFFTIEAERAYGAGPELPRLHVVLQGKTPSDAMVCDELHLHGSLKLGPRVLGVGSVSRANLGSVQQLIEVVVPLGPPAMGALIAHPVPDTVELALDFSGTMTAHHTGEKPVLGFHLPMEAHERRTVPVQINDLRLQIPRSDWYVKVLQPTGIAEYILMEVRVPLGDIGQKQRKAATLVAEADRCLASGDAPGAFFRCRAAMETLAGFPAQIYDGVPDTLKRARINALAKAIGEYLHAGRHVAKEGPREGEFDVDHRDAQFAIGITKCLLAYTSQVVA